jgi:hypothetical protein
MPSNSTTQLALGVGLGVGLCDGEGDGAGRDDVGLGDGDGEGEGDEDLDWRTPGEWPPPRRAGALPVRLADGTAAATCRIGDVAVARGCLSCARDGAANGAVLSPLPPDATFHDDTVTIDTAAPATTATARHAKTASGTCRLRGGRYCKSPSRSALARNWSVIRSPITKATLTSSGAG